MTKAVADIVAAEADPDMPSPTAFAEKVSPVGVVGPIFSPAAEKRCWTMSASLPS
ncbi:hypothetical protein AAII07_24490 [Microvirga sp. 0TCS3.31]